MGYIFRNTLCWLEIKLALDEHNHFHRSGNLNPSTEDTRLTDRMIRLTQLMGIPLLNHYALLNIMASIAPKPYFI